MLKVNNFSCPFREFAAAPSNGFSVRLRCPARWPRCNEFLRLLFYFFFLYIFILWRLFGWWGSPRYRFLFRFVRWRQLLQLHVKWPLCLQRSSKFDRWVGAAVRLAFHPKYPETRSFNNWFPCNDEEWLAEALWSWLETDTGNFATFFDVDWWKTEEIVLG